MGKLKEIISSVDQSQEITAETKETLNLLYELSKEKADSFAKEISTKLRTAGTSENLTIPITQELGSHQEVRVITSSTPDQDIVDNIGNSLKQILTGCKNDIIGGLTGLINTGLTTVLGAAEGEERFEHSYYIATEGLAIVRMDLMYWSRHITASGITKYAEKSLVCTAVKSSVDVNKIDFNTFLAAYQAQLLRCSFEQEQLLEEIRNAKKIYEELKENVSGSKMHGMSAMQNKRSAPKQKALQQCGTIQSIQQMTTADKWPAVRN